MNQTISKILERRSIRAYLPEQIPEDSLQQIIEAGLAAPTGMNRQSCKFTVLQGEPHQRLTLAITKAVLEGNLHFRAKDESYRCNYNAPTWILVSEDRENKIGYADCACALENMMLAATALGLGSCWVNQVYPTCDMPEIREILTSFGIPESHIVYGSAAIGYAAETPRALERKEGRVIRP